MSAKKKNNNYKLNASSGTVENRLPQRKRTSWEVFLEPLDSDKFWHRNLWFILAFAIPSLLMYICFMFMEVSPAGDNQILVTDLWHQYYPFLVDFQDKLQEGSSLLWTWKSGGGVNYLSVISYYLASPLNFLSVLVPAEYLREFLTVITCAKVGFASLFFAQFIRIVFKKRDISVTAFGIMYGLSAFVMGYYWNVIWLDTIALLPLVVAGAVCVLKEGKFRLYVIALALAVMTNYYIGLFVCIFIVLISIVYCIVEFTTIVELFKRFVRMLGYSLLGVSITALLTLPAFFALMSTQSSVEPGTTYSNTPPVGFAMYLCDVADKDDIWQVLGGMFDAFKQILASCANFVAPNVKNADFPNVYCGIAILVMAVMYFTCGKIKIREKIATGVLCLVFFLSFTVKWLDFIWHGLHFPNMLPYRYSFLFSFVILVMAYRLYMNLDSVKLKSIGFSMILLLIVFGIIATNVDTIITEYSELVSEQGQEYAQKLANIAVYGTVVIVVLMLLWVMMRSFEVIPKRAFSVALLIICMAEAICSVYFGLSRVGVTTTTSYPLGTDNTLDVVEYIDELEQDSNELNRAEVTKYHTLNDNALIGTNGISMFSSMVNSSVTAYMEKFGLSGWVSSNRFTYQESSPVTNMFLNIKYLISPYGKHLDKTHTRRLYSSGEVALLQNTYSLPVGFMVDKDMLSFDVKKASDNPFDNQNEIFRLATGIEEDVYTPLDVVNQGHTEASKFKVNKYTYGYYGFNVLDNSVDPHFKFNYYPEKSGIALAYYQCGESDNVTLKVNDNTVITNYVKRPYIMQVGNVNAGDKISVYADLKDASVGSAKVYCVMLNEDIFEQGYNKLKEESLKSTKTTDTLIEGTITAKEDGLFYTSISYDAGWSAYVDGEQVEVTPVAGAQVAFEVPKGEHEIRLEYTPKGFTVGLVISIAGMLIFIALILWTTKRDWVLKILKKQSVVNETTE